MGIIIGILIEIGLVVILFPFFVEGVIFVAKLIGIIAAIVLILIGIIVIVAFCYWKRRDFDKILLFLLTCTVLYLAFTQH